MTGQRIDVEIEELVLHGFPPLDRHALGEIVERRLVSLLTGPPDSAPSARDPSLDSGDREPVRVSPDAIVQSLGSGIAAAISRRISR